MCWCAGVPGRWHAVKLGRWYAGVLGSREAVTLGYWIAGVLASWALPGCVPRANLKNGSEVLTRASEPRQTIASARQFNDPQRKHSPDRTGNTHYKVRALDTRSPGDTRPYTSGCNVQMSDNPRWLRFHALSFIQTSFPSPRRMLPQVACCLLFSSSAALYLTQWHLYANCEDYSKDNPPDAGAGGRRRLFLKLQV